MRTDPKAKDIPLTPRQHFFASSWFNMVHQHSLDSHRVRTMNPRNVLRELLRMWDATHANNEDRVMVRDRAIVVLSAFRLYRLGADANSFERKLANWWTAIEFLVRGLKGGTKIGAAVEHNVTPVL
jgi:hypothetical protein